MESKENVEINKLTQQIDDKPNDFNLYVCRAKLYYKLGQFDKSLNDFVVADEIEPNNVEVLGYIDMLKEVFDYRYMDIYNP